MIATEDQRVLAKDLPVVCMREDTAGAREAHRRQNVRQKKKSVTTRVVWKTGQPRRGWRHGTRNATSGTIEGSVFYALQERERPTN